MNVLTYITQSAFVVLGVLSGIEYIRLRGAIRRDVALMFGALAASIGIQAVADLFTTPLPFLDTVGSLILVAHPYLLLRLIQYFRPLPDNIGYVALAGMVTSWVLVALGGSELSRVAALIIVIYFVFIDAYTMFAFTKGVLTSSGIMKRRFRFTAAGSGLFGLAILMAGVASIVSASPSVVQTAILGLAFGSALSFYFGLVPPRWLIGFWQLNELKGFLSQLSGSDASKTSKELYRLVSQTSLRITSGKHALIALHDDETPGWKLYSPEDETSERTLKSESAVDQYLHMGSAVAVQVEELSESMQGELGSNSADLIYFVPLIQIGQRSNVLLIFLHHGSLFVDDDLDLLSLLASQAAVALENVTLVEALDEHNRLLEATVRQRTAELEQQNTHINLLQEVTVAANEATTISEPFQNAIELIGGSLDVEIGHVYAPTEDAVMRLSSTTIWHVKDPIKYKPFQNVTETLQFSSQPSEIGKIISTGKPLWMTQITENPNFRRAEVAREVGIMTGIFVPVLSEQKIVAVLEFFSDKDLPPDEELLNLLVNIGTQLGRVVERKQTEIEIRNNEARFRALFESAPAGIVMVGQDGQIVMLNDKGVKMFGYQRDELIGKQLEDLLPERLRTKHTEHRMDFFSAPQSRPMGVGLDLVGRRKDGSEFPIVVGLSYIQTLDGEIAVAYVSDITEQKRAQEALLESERRYHRIVDNMMEGFQIIGFDWQYLYINHAAAQHGRYPREELIGNKITEKYPGIEETEMFASLRTCMEERVEQQIENEFVYPDGSSAWFELSIQPVPEGLFILSLNVTERKQAEIAMRQLNEELERRVKERTVHLEAVNKELEAFSYSVSHDLRAPLRAVDGFSLALLEDFHDMLDEEGQEYLKLIRDESQRMGHLIDDLIRLSRYTRTEIRDGSIDLSYLARDVASELQRQDPHRSVEFTIEDGVVGQGDSDLMRAVIQNLFDNAWKYTGKEEHAQIGFGVTDANGQAEYFIRDNGVGFDMKYAHKLFGAFQRLHANSEFPGTGIGLATVQRIIHRHGGTVRAEGQVGQGTTIYFTLGTGDEGQ